MTPWYEEQEIIDGIITDFEELKGTLGYGHDYGLQSARDHLHALYRNPPGSIYQQLAFICEAHQAISKIIENLHNLPVEEEPVRELEAKIKDLYGLITENVVSMIREQNMFRELMGEADKAAADALIRGLETQDEESRQLFSPLETPIESDRLTDIRRHLKQFLEAETPAQERQAIRNAHEAILGIIRRLHSQGQTLEADDPIREVERNVQWLYDHLQERAAEAGPEGYLRDDPDQAQGRSPG
jgi:hypothetical protein